MMQMVHMPNLENWECMYMYNSITLYMYHDVLTILRSGHNELLYIAYENHISLGRKQSSGLDVN